MGVDGSRPSTGCIVQLRQVLLEHPRTKGWVIPRNRVAIDPRNRRAHAFEILFEASVHNAQAPASETPAHPL